MMKQNGNGNGRNRNPGPNANEDTPIPSMVATAASIQATATSMFSTAPPAVPRASSNSVGVAVGVVIPLLLFIAAGTVVAIVIGVLLTKRYSSQRQSSDQLRIRVQNNTYVSHPPSNLSGQNGYPHHYHSFSEAEYAEVSLTPGTNNMAVQNGLAIHTGSADSGYETSENWNATAQTVNGIGNGNSTHDVQIGNGNGIAGVISHPEPESPQPHPLDNNRDSPTPGTCPREQFITPTSCCEGIKNEKATDDDEDDDDDDDARSSPRQPNPSPIGDPTLSTSQDNIESIVELASSPKMFKTPHLHPQGERYTAVGGARYYSCADQFPFKPELHLEPGSSASGRPMSLDFDCLPTNIAPLLSRFRSENL